MTIRYAAPASLLLLLAGGCGGTVTQAKSADDAVSTDKTAQPTAPDRPRPAPPPGVGDDATSKSANNPCTGFELDLMEALNRSACEVPNVKHDVKAQEVKDKVVVTALVPTATVAPGAHSDIIVTIKNKTAAPALARLPGRPPALASRSRPTARRAASSASTSRPATSRRSPRESSLAGPARPNGAHHARRQRRRHRQGPLGRLEDALGTREAPRLGPRAGLPQGARRALAQG